MEVVASAARAAPATPAIDAEQLVKTYAGGVEALRGISFAVQPGEVFGLLGPNGAGKTTTVRILTTLSVATAGRARVAGFDVAREPQQVRQRIGLVAQASGVDELSTGRENLLLQGQIFRIPRQALQQRIAELLQLFRLEDAADRVVRTYSGGMRRRLDVAMGLIHRPQVLFLDEPTTGLDPESRKVMWRELEALAAGGLTILLTTHYLEEADRLAQRLAIVDRGQVVAAGTPDELKAGLGGDLVTLEIQERASLPRALEILERLPDVARVLADGPRLFADVRSGPRCVPAIVNALEAAGLLVAQVALSRPSLDDVYLRATGHAYEAAGSAGEEKP